MKLKVGYWKPTPRVFRVVGDAMLSTATAMLGYAVFTDSPQWMYWIAGGLLVGKILTNIPTEHTDENK